jgi:OmpA-OmpF porin, OOP family
MNKTILFGALFLLHGILSNAQTADKKWGLGLHFGTIQYQGDYGSEFFKYKDAHPAGMLSVSRYLTAFAELEGNLSGGLLDYAWKDANNLHNSFEGRLFNLELLFKYKLNNGKLLKENSRLAPYLFLGLGDGIYQNKIFFPNGENITFNFPMGGGIRLNLTERVAIDLRLNYHYTLTEFYDGLYPRTSKWNDQFLTSSAGIVFNIDKKDADKDGVRDRSDLCANTPLHVLVDAKGCPNDKDRDGVPDYLDKCPDINGTIRADGCSDADNDGVQDKDDACPQLSGLAALGGCPDKDNDGIPDNKDKCPGVSGLASLYGCPDKDGDGITDAEDNCPDAKGDVIMKGCPDTDRDGVADAQDTCPTIPGSAINKGCPEIKGEVQQVLADALKGVQFESGKEIIKPSSFMILDEVVKVMTENKEYRLDINGYTDNLGDDNKNKILSQKRADAVRAYLVRKGISVSRLNAMGFGEENPIESNDTPAGRVKNRRVEFKIVF